MHVGVAGQDVQARERLAGSFELDTVALVVCRCVAILGADLDVAARHVALLGLEHRTMQLQALIEQAGLDAGFQAFAFEWIKQLAVQADIAVLRREDLRPTGVEAPLRGQVVDQAGVRRDLAVHAQAVIRPVAFARTIGAEHSRTGDPVQVVGQAEARAGKDAFLRVVEVLRVDVAGVLESWQCLRAGQNAGERGVVVAQFGGIVFASLLMGAPVTGAQRQLVVIATKQAEGPGYLGFAQQLMRFAGGVCGKHRCVVTCDAGDVEHVGVLLFGDPGRRQRTVPAIAEIVLQLGEDLLRVHVPVGPWLADAGATAAVMQGVAVGIDQRQVAPGAAIGVTVVLRKAHRQRVGVGHIKGQQAGGDVSLVAVAIQPGVALVMGIDKAPAHVRRGGQGPRDVDVDAAAVPRTGTGTDLRLEFVGRALAHEVDRRRGVAGAAHQTIGAMQYVYLLVFGHVDIADQKGLGERHAHAVVLESTDFEPAGGELGAIGFGLLNGDRGRRTQGILDAGDLEVVQLRAGDGGDCLRRLLVGQPQLGRAGGRRAAVSLA